MAYQTGTLTTISDIVLAIRTFLTSNGWTWDSGSNTIYKDSMFISMVTTDPRVIFKGKTSLGSAESGYAAMGRVRETSSEALYPMGDIVFPATYYAFLANDEFYFILNHSTVVFQYVIFGKSTIDLSASAGLGTYFSASIGVPGLNEATPGSIACFSDGHLGGSGNFTQTCAAPFYMQRSASGPTPPDFIHTGLSAGPWDLLNGNVTIGNAYNYQLLDVMPNAWNGESPFLPIRCYKSLASSKCALVLDLQHARQCRVDNYNDAETVTIGPDEWIVFPFYKKDAVNRNGAFNSAHSGTFGWAIRKVL